jgi:hypothetical protein
LTRTLFFLFAEQSIQDISLAIAFRVLEHIGETLDVAPGNPFNMVGD